MPDAVAERFVLYGSKPGDVVLDPFCGSGTTLLAAQKYGRRFVGYDLNAEYVNVAKERLAANFRPVNAVVASFDAAVSSPGTAETKLWMNVQELSVYIGVAVSTIYGKNCHGEIPVVKMGRLLRFNRNAIDEWLLSQARATTAISKPGESAPELNTAN